MNLSDAYDLAEKLIKLHELHDWTFRFDGAKTRFGCCNFTKKQISLSRQLVSLNPAPIIYDTILHEIAHALIGPHHGHSALWKEKIKSLGGIPKARYHHSEVTIPKGKYTVTCPFCKLESQANKQKKVACKNCCKRYNNGIYTEKFRLIFRENDHERDFV